MSDQSDARVQHVDGDDLEAEAQEIVELFNDAAAPHSPDLKWFGMSLDQDTMKQFFVLAAETYIDPDGLAALRDHGREVRYIEAHAPIDFEGSVTVQIEIPVQNGVTDA